MPFLPNATTTTKDSKAFFVYLTCIYILTWYLQLGIRVNRLGAIRFEFFLGAFLSFCALVMIARSREVSPLRGALIFYFTVMCLYVLFSIDITYSWNIFLNRVIKFSMLAVFLAAFIRTPWALKMAVGAFMLAMLKMGQEGFVGWLTGGMVWQNQGIMRLHGSTPLYAHPNSFSGMAVGCLPFIYYLYPVVARHWRVLLLAMFGFCLVIIIFTGSRTGYLATVGLGFLFLKKSSGRETKRYLLIVALLCIGMVAFLPSDYVDRFHSIFTMEEKEGASAEARLQIIKDAVQVYAHYPLGVGLGTFPKVRQQLFGRSQDTHNLYLELLTNMGPLGLLAFFVMIRRILHTNSTLQQWLQDATDFADGPFLLSVSKAVVAFVYVRLFLGVFGMDTYEVYWWFAAGLTVALWNVVRSETRNNTNGDA